MYILRKKAQKLKNITFLYFMAIFHNFAFKVEIGWATRVFNPILEIKNVNDVYENVWSLKNQ